MTDLERAARVRIGAALAIASGLSFAVVDTLGDPEELASLYLLKAVQIGALVAVALWLRRRPEDWAAGALVGLFSLAATMAGAGGVRGDVAVAPTLLSILLIAAPVFVGWGVRLQAVVAVIGSLSFAANLLLVDGDLARATSHAGLAFLVAVLLSLYVGRLNDRVERQREESERLRSDVASMLTHDIRNPLAVVQGLADMILAEEPGLSATSRESLRQIGASARRATLLANNFLDDTRCREGRLSITMESTDVEKLLSQVARSQRPVADTRGISIEAAVDGAPAKFPLDPHLTERALTNLVDNAIKHSPEGGSVRIEARIADGGPLEIRVEDSGPGLPADSDVLFERFQGSGSGSTSMGLGLYIVKQIAEAHGGTVRASDREDGHGARFELRFPVHGVDG